MKIWDKLDEVAGAAMLTFLVALAMILGYDHGLAQAGITGIVALLVTKVVRKPVGDEDAKP